MEGESQRKNRVQQNQQSTNTGGTSQEAARTNAESNRVVHQTKNLIFFIVFIFTLHSIQQHPPFHVISMIIDKMTFRHSDSLKILKIIESESQCLVDGHHIHHRHHIG